jgi:hypothetical protein
MVTFKLLMIEAMHASTKKLTSRPPATALAALCRCTVSLSHWRAVALARGQPLSYCACTRRTLYIPRPARHRSARLPASHRASESSPHATSRLCLRARIAYCMVPVRSAGRTPPDCCFTRPVGRPRCMVACLRPACRLILICQSHRP